MVKVCHIQFSMESGGRGALRLQKALRKSNVDSNIVSLRKNDQGLFNVTYLNNFSRLISRLDNRLQGVLTKNVITNLGFFSFPILGSNVAKLEEIKNADVIYIHWALNGLLNFKSFKEIAALKKPVIIFLHDMWAITGGCHHSFTCEKYMKEGCNNCPMFPSQRKHDLSYREFRKKSQLYNNHDNLYFVSPSKWLYDCAKKSLLTKDKPIFYIPNILDQTLFKPFDKLVAKQILSIDKDEIVISFGAISVGSPYKGWPYLQKALELLFRENDRKNVLVLIFGSNYNKAIAESIPFKTRFMGYLKDEYSAALIYNAVDVFIAPSLAEAFGYVVMEALCCGTPVVGFDVGGIPDMIRHKENGYLAKYKDAEDLYNGIKFCLQNNIKGYLPEDLNADLTLKKHLQLFDNVLANTKNSTK